MNKTIRAIIVGRPDQQLIDWFQRHGQRYEVRSHSYEPAIARNLAIQEFLKTDYDDLMMIDGDQFPITGARILEANSTPLSYCGSPSRNTTLKGHFGDDDFSAGCFRCSREVLVAIKDRLDEHNERLARIDFPFAQPIEFGWFGRAVRFYGSDEFHCSCEWFNGLARSIGYRAEMVDTIGHAGLVLTPEHTAFATGARFVG